MLYFNHIAIISKRISSDYLDSNVYYDFFEILITNDLLKDKDIFDSLLFDSQVVLLLLDITDQESLDMIKQLSDLVEFSDYCSLKVILLENKKDLETERKIESEEINNFMTEKKIEEKIQISIKEGEGLEELAQIIKKYTSIEENNIPINYISQDKYQNAFDENLDIEYDLSFILIGNSNVGKTCFFTRFQSNEFQENFLSTIGMDKNVKCFKYKDKMCKVTLWDTAGQDRYKCITKKYYQNANGIFLFYDLTNKESFNDISVWINDITTNTSFASNKNEKNKIAVYLIGNKLDRPNRAISKEEAEEKASFYGIKYYEISCKLNLNLCEITTGMIEDCISKIETKGGDKKKVGQQNDNKSISMVPAKHQKIKKGKTKCC